MDEDDKTENLIIGSALVGISIIGCVSYGLVLIAIVKSKEMMKQPFYHFIVSLGVSDVLSLVGIFILSDKTLFSPYFAGFVLIFETYGWEVLIYHLLLLAFNRYCVICRWKWDTKLFRKKNMSRYWVSAAWLLGIVWWITGMWPPGTYFDGNFINAGVWPIESVQVFYQTHFDMWRCVVVFLLSGYFYAKIFLLQRNSRKKVVAHKTVRQPEQQAENNSNNGNNRTETKTQPRAGGRNTITVGLPPADNVEAGPSGRMNEAYKKLDAEEVQEEGKGKEDGRKKAEGKKKKEGNSDAGAQIRFALQVGIVTVFFVIYDIWFYKGPQSWYENSVLAFFAYIFPWGFNNAINPFIYLMFNKALRGEVAKLMRLGKLGKNRTGVSTLQASSVVTAVDRVRSRRY